MEVGLPELRRLRVAQVALYLSARELFSHEKSARAARPPRADSRRLPIATRR